MSASATEACADTSATAKDESQLPHLPESPSKRLLPKIPNNVRPVRPKSAGATLQGRLRSVGGASEASSEQVLAQLRSSLSSQAVAEAGSRIGATSPSRAVGKRVFVSPVKFAPPEGVDSSVTVAVRVRPFSKREQRLGASQVVRMHGNETIVTSHDGVVHRFFYDHCFWSFTPQGSRDDGQTKVYEALAQPLLDRSFEGYNTCLFAYGQTGSGKSYCIMGEGEEQGIVPRFSKELFDRIEGTQDSEMSYKVQVSYYEIYIEKIYDLLASTKFKSKSKLRVREHPVMGPYVEDLATFVATSYQDIERWINLGNRFRATAATGMNDKSSRSHSVFTIMLTQTSVLEGEEHSKVSRINLIDLAGSERSSVAMTTGERLREGANINRSLHTLGKVISLLSEKSTGKRKKVYIPYRDSTLTWLLKESLGGNSKTAMIATISPANLHYEESLSTLRYAQQARTIVNIARINEDPNARIIRDLRSEIEYLRSFMGQGAGPGASLIELRELRDQLRESEKLMQEATRSWQEKLRDTEARKREELELLRKSGMLKVDNSLPNLVNLNEDPQLSEMLLYVLKEGATRVGPTSSYDIQLTGALVSDNHCTISYSDGCLLIDPSDKADAQTFINGSLISVSTELHHGDRVVIGGEHFFRLNHPLEVEHGASSLGKREGVKEGKSEGGFEHARNELIKAQTQRLEAELEEKRLLEREQYMRDLQSMKESAQEDIEHQRERYETRLKSLSTQMEEKEEESLVLLQTHDNDETEKKLLRQRNRELEEETLEQKHLIELEKIKTEKEYAEMEQQKSALMTDLETEKRKLEEDISTLHRNKALREKASHRDSITSPPSSDGVLRGSELVRLAMMLQEASAISKNLGKPLTFGREEHLEGGEPEVRVRVNNTQLGLVSYWDLGKFESRLEQMRDVYQSGGAPCSSMTSLDTDGSSVSEEADPFHDPSDVWAKDSLVTPHSSPHRAGQLRHSLLSGASPALSSSSPGLPSARKGEPLKAFATDLFSVGSSPAVATPDWQTRGPPSYALVTQSVPRVCCDSISTVLQYQEGVPVSVYQRALDHVSLLRDAGHALEEAFDRHMPTPDISIPFSETAEVRCHAVALHSSLHQLVEVGKTLHEEAGLLETLLVGPRRSGASGGSAGGQAAAGQLVTVLCHQTALYCSRLLQGVDRGVEDAIRDSQLSLDDSLDSVTVLLGQLSLSQSVHEAALTARLHASEHWQGGSSEEFLSSQSYQKSAPLFLQGYRDCCVVCIETTSHFIQTRLGPVQHANTSSHLSEEHSPELLNLVCTILSTAISFLQRLAEMQAPIWNLDGSLLEDGTLPLTPSTSHVVSMLLHLERLEKSVSGLALQACQLDTPPSETTPAMLPPPSPYEKLMLCNGHAVLCCNELAASILTVLKRASSEAGLEFPPEVRSLSHEIARAGKSLNHYLKKHGLVGAGSSTAGGRGKGGRGKQHRLPAAGHRHSATSMATGQITHSSPSPPPVSSPPPSVTSPPPPITSPPPLITYSPPPLSPSPPLPGFSEDLDDSCIV